MNQTRQPKILILAGLALLGLGSALSSLSVEAADTVIPQTIELARVDVQKLATGYRASKIIGANVQNDANDNIGKVDDLIVSPDDNKSAFVVISVGGFLGIGNKLVALPFDNLRISNNRLMMPGATKEGLKALPEFKYSSN